MPAPHEPRALQAWMRTAARGAQVSRSPRTTLMQAGRGVAMGVGVAAGVVSVDEGGDGSLQLMAGLGRAFGPAGVLGAGVVRVIVMAGIELTVSMVTIASSSS